MKNYQLINLDYSKNEEQTNNNKNQDNFSNLNFHCSLIYVQYSFSTNYHIIHLTFFFLPKIFQRSWLLTIMSKQLFTYLTIAYTLNGSRNFINFCSRALIYYVFTSQLSFLFFIIKVFWYQYMTACPFLKTHTTFLLCR